MLHAHLEYNLRAVVVDQKNRKTIRAPIWVTSCLYEHYMGAINLHRITSRLSVSSRPPKLPRSAFDAHWSPLEAWYLGCIRIPSTGSIYPLTYEKGGGQSASCANAINAVIAGAVAVCAIGELRTKQTAKVETKIDENRAQHIPIANPAPCSSATPHVLTPEEQIDANDPLDVV
jgi:hypothetical protein